MSSMLKVESLLLDFKTHRITDMRKAKAKKKARIAWSKDEVKLLKRLYPDGGAEEIAELTGRPSRVVRQKHTIWGLGRESVVSGKPTKLDYSKSSTEMRMHKV